MKSILISISLLCFFLSACGPGPTPKPTLVTRKPTSTTVDNLPRIIPHSAPNLPRRWEVFMEAGCSGRPTEYWNCKDDSPLSLLGCKMLPTDAFLGGMDPPYPIMHCAALGYNAPPDDSLQHFTVGGCMDIIYRSYVIFKDDGFQLVNGESEFQALYAPITSPDEALSYALVTTGLYPSYEKTVYAESYMRPKYLTEEIENTYVRETTSGYIVHLFEGPMPECGCGSHTWNTVDVLVTKEGEVTRMDPDPIYEIEVCID